MVVVEFPFLRRLSNHCKHDRAFDAAGLNHLPHECGKYAKNAANNGMNQKSDSSVETWMFLNF